jgi:hypothetical protein
VVISDQDLQVVLKIEKKITYFLLETGASYLGLFSNPGLFSPKNVTVKGITAKALTRHFCQPLNCD